VSFASDRFPHRALHGSTALHYTCLVGDMEIVGVLLGHGAKWTKHDSIDLLPNHYVDVSNGDSKKVEFKYLCEEETLKSGCYSPTRLRCNHVICKQHQSSWNALQRVEEGKLSAYSYMLHT